MTPLRTLALLILLAACATAPAPPDCPEAIGGDEETDGGIGGTGHAECPPVTDDPA